MKKCPIIFILLSMSLIASSQHDAKTPVTADTSDLKMEWWKEARFGMFIHWGIYSITGGVWDGVNTYGEWMMLRTERVAAL